MKRILFFDTETNGLPRNFNAPAFETSNWPRLLQFGYILADEDRNVLDEGGFLIRPDGFTVPTSASNIHHITTEKATAEGISLSDALSKIQSLVSNVDLLVGHNVSFDIHIVDAEFYRTQKVLRMARLPYICTMVSSEYYCNLPNHKWPKLSELYGILFNQSFEDAHNAQADVKATYKCFWELVDRGVIAFSKDTQKSDAPAEIKEDEKTKLNAEVLSDFKAINWFRHKLLQTNLDSTYEDQEQFLSKFFDQSEENAAKQELTDFQSSFIDKIFTRTIEKYPDLFEGYDNKEDRFYRAVGFSMLDHIFGLSESKEYRDKVIKKYYPLLTEYMPEFEDYIINNQRFDLASSTKEAFIAYGQLEKEHNAVLDQLTNPLTTIRFIPSICSRFGPKVSELKQKGIDDRIYSRVVTDYFVGILEAANFLLRTIGGTSVSMPGTNDADTLQNAVSALDNLKDQVFFPEKESQSFNNALEIFRAYVPKKKKFRFW